MIIMNRSGHGGIRQLVSGNRLLDTTCSSLLLCYQVQIVELGVKVEFLRELKSFCPDLSIIWMVKE